MKARYVELPHARIRVIWSKNQLQVYNVGSEAVDLELECEKPWSLSCRRLDANEGCVSYVDSNYGLIVKRTSED